MAERGRFGQPRPAVSARTDLRLAPSLFPQSRFLCMDRSTAAHTKPEVMKMEDLPLGFGMALAQHPEAMARFSALSEEEQQAIIDGTHAVRSKQEMQAYVENLMK